MDQGARYKALRLALGLTQATVAERGGIARDKVTKYETGASKGRSHDLRLGLARAVGLAPADMDLYLAGDLPLADAKARAATAAAPRPATPAVLLARESVEPTPDEDATPQLIALAKVFALGGYTVEDDAAARAFLPSSMELRKEGWDLDALAVEILGAARTLRRLGLPTDPKSIRVRLVTRHADLAAKEEALHAAAVAGQAEAPDFGIASHVTARLRAKSAP